MYEHQSLCLHVSAWPSVCPYISSCPSMPISRCKLITLTSMFIFMQVYMSRSLSLACILFVCEYNNSQFKSMYPSVHLPVLSIYLSNYLSGDLFVFRSVYLSVYIPIRPTTTHPSSHSSMHPDVRLSVCRHSRAFTCLRDVFNRKRLMTGRA